MRTCDACDREVEDDFRFCPRCGSPLRLKIVEHFRPLDDRDGWLRVSVYLRHPQHVRFSIWRDGVAQAATSLDPTEVERLADFLSVPVSRALAVTVRRRVAAVRAAVLDRTVP